MLRDWLREDARRDFLRELIEERFGPLPPAASDRLNAMYDDQLVPTTKAILHATSLKDLGLADE